MLKFFLLFFFYFSILYSQNIGPVIILEEKKPTTRFPNYQPSLIPYFLRKDSKINPAQSYILNPNLSIEDYLKSQETRQVVPVIISNSEESYLRNLSDNEIRKYYFQKYFLPQLGIERQKMDYNLSFLQEPKIHETKWERRFTIFMLSFPMVSGLTYGVYKNYKSNQGGKKGLDKNETIGIFSFGAIFSLFVIYYDENHFKGIQNYSEYLKNQKN